MIQWIVYTQIGNGLTDELENVIGPFASEEEARTYMDDNIEDLSADYVGVFKISKPKVVVQK